MTDSFFPPGGEQVGTTDAPRHPELRHPELRRVLAPASNTATIRKLEGPLAEDTATLLDEIVPGETVDWIRYATLVPIKATSGLIGLRSVDEDHVHSWSDELEKLGGDLTFGELRAAAKEFSSLQAYMREIIAEKRGVPGDTDLTTSLLQEELDGNPVSEADIIMLR
ncbi:cytochrome P450 [Pseudonocardia kujensis]|uniref:cytochrome P450 n=1 Tax=Pseudonocardia kujensis TaxID=1128675 RepID=UPI001E64A05A|nr:cytochrome P450 [Pseudonocardia kujensis]MCE0763517.1 cytochrome P450 [Pseudonocardia kujensis]